ncbi:hypothetical protein ACTJJ0_13025 [Chitinophaga sp. 22321]|uniref:Uncharacterized protein n=1 Tax=Chitinophaga hostae TaxID=2831022 RepID=A0ABS5J0W2_9BACT|nr:hypothetical protein [Chitinophaga hostae]MBS0028863.1 hypothetical protein [Chitinophaga hostae]
MNDTPDPKHLEETRYRLGGYYYDVLLPRLKKEDAKKVLQIEHYLQNDILQTLPLNKVMGN